MQFGVKLRRAKVATAAILYKLYTIYQPGGGAERSNLLRSLTDLRLGASVHDVLTSIRAWRRWLNWAEELQITVPDSMILVQTCRRWLMLCPSMVAPRLDTDWLQRDKNFKLIVNHRCQR